MKKCILIVVCLLTSFFSNAQKSPLNGSGIVENKTFGFKNFNKITLSDMDGMAEIEVGKPFSIAITIDDNLASILKVTENDNELKISLTGNRNKKKYIENTNMKIKIAVPVLTSYFQNGNNSVVINGILAEDFEAIVKGNGSAILSGTTNNLNALCTSNGTINAKTLKSKNVTATAQGNGNVYVNATDYFMGSTMGNGNAINIGKAKPSNTLKEGNGEVITENAEIIKEKDKTKNNKSSVEVILKNSSKKNLSLSIKYPVKGSYGINLKPNESKQESFPIGTKIFKGNQFTTFKKPLLIINALDANKVLECSK